MVAATRSSRSLAKIRRSINLSTAGFLIPMTFGAPWVVDPVASCKTAFGAFTCFYVVCLVVTWFFYRRSSAEMAKAGV